MTTTEGIPAKYLEGSYTYRGIGVQILGWAEKWEPCTYWYSTEDWEFDNAGEDIQDYLSAEDIEAGGIWAGDYAEDGEYIPDPDSGNVVICWAGDDREQTVALEDLVEGDYCPGCGQVGCHAYEF